MKKSIIISLILFIFTINIYGKSTIVYPHLNGLGENAFGFHVLKLALSKVEDSYDITLSKHQMNGARANEFLKTGEVSVCDGGIGEEQAEDFDVIYIPIDRGLLGWRIFMINKDSQDDFHKIKDLNGLKTKVAGQGPTWPDRYIIESSGIKVATASKIQLLVNMVEGKRFDFFPLGASEAHGFLENFGKNKPKLVIEDSIALVYPFARFFYVKKGDKKLYANITLGLERAFEDGSFQELVSHHPFFKKGLEEADLKNRTIIRIDNPFLPEEFYSIDSKWWYKAN